jgi:hypothetical protein
MMRDDTFHHCASHGFRAHNAGLAHDRRDAGFMTRTGPVSASVFPLRNLWQPSHGYIARLHGILAHWLQPYRPDPNTFGGRA